MKNCKKNMKFGKKSGTLPKKKNLTATVYTMENI